MFRSANPQIGRHAAEATARVLVTTVTDANAPAMPSTADLLRWRQQNPLAVWTHVDVPSGSAELRRAALIVAVAAARDPRHRHPSQLILLGARAAGRLALELVLEGVLACDGIVVTDIPCGPLRSPIVLRTAAVRLVAHKDGPVSEHGLIDALRAADIDERILMLPPGSARDAEATASATGTFLLELVATISRQASNGVRSHDDQD
ncbi:hypothetical protein [Bradyrhizobium genosp. P]|uniref:hypothetical protein n=1 Tax=Bradyrhizobium genosp. P TaxID=83641 RepID=UPI003CF1EAC3